MYGGHNRCNMSKLTSLLEFHSVSEGERRILALEDTMSDMVFTIRSIREKINIMLVDNVTNPPLDFADSFHLQKDNVRHFTRSLNEWKRVVVHEEPKPLWVMRLSQSLGYLVATIGPHPDGRPGAVPMLVIYTKRKSVRRTVNNDDSFFAKLRPHVIKGFDRYCYLAEHGSVQSRRDFHNFIPKSSVDGIYDLFNGLNGTDDDTPSIAHALTMRAQ